MNGDLPIVTSSAEVGGVGVGAAADDGDAFALGRFVRSRQQGRVGRGGAVFDGDAVKTGSAAGSAKVTGTIAEHGRAQKVLVFKFKRKKQYRRTIGHRQNFTRVKVNEISA